MTEQTSRKAQTRQALIDAAPHVIATKGLDASIEEYSEAAKFTRGAFYSNFSGRTELFAAILEQEFNHAMTALAEAMAQQGPSDEGLVATVVDNYLALWVTDADTQIATAEIRLAATRDPALRAQLTRIDALYKDALIPLMTNAIEVHNFKCALPVDTLAMLIRAVALTAFVDGIVEGKLDSAVVRHQLTQVLSALLTPADSPE